MTHLMLLLALVVATPSTRPAAAPQLSAREIHDLHVQAVALMRQNQYNQAADFLEKVYNAVALEKRDRALVLNHAILDLAQKRFVMRGMRDLSAYLIKHRDEDEPGMNILGALLNTAIVDQPTLKSGALWQSAFKEWDRRNYVLDHSRKGWRRWGTRWIDDDERKSIQMKQ